MVGAGVALLCGVTAVAMAPSGSADSSAVAGAPAVLSAPSSLTGLKPQIPDDVVKASSAPGSTWTPEKAVYGTATKSDIHLTGATGTPIEVNETYPTDADGTPAKGPFPVILTMTPYGKDVTGNGTVAPLLNAGVSDYLVRRGYIDVVMDIRGTNSSGGQESPLDPLQTQDEKKVLDWAAKLPESNGKVGTTGASYLGMDQLMLAGSVGKNSPLKAIFPMVAANDLYRDTMTMGGLLDAEFGLAYFPLTLGLSTVPVGGIATEPQDLAALTGITLDHVAGAGQNAALLGNMMANGDQRYDGSYWQERAPQNLLSKIVANGIPAYLTGGEFDIFQNGEPLNYAGLQNAYDGRPASAAMEPGQATTGRYQLLDGPWGHLNGAGADYNELELEWFDTWLKGENTGMATTPTPLHYYDLGSGAFDETTTYPFTGATPTSYYFGSGGTMSTTAPASSSSSSDTVAWSPAGIPCGRPVDQWAMSPLNIAGGTLGLPAPCASADNLTQLGPWAKTYTTAPFAKAQTVEGPITATVYAKASTTETQWAAEVEMVTPGGQSYPLTEGAQLGSLRAVDPSRSWTADGKTIYPYHPFTQHSVIPVTPGATEKYQIQVFPTLATIPAGDRLRVTISTADVPHLAATPREYANLAGGIYQIQRTSAAPSSLTVELHPANLG